MSAPSSPTSIQPISKQKSISTQVRKSVLIARESKLLKAVIG
jgi:hypothetical protein